jgi:hypothetical protein
VNAWLGHVIEVASLALFSWCWMALRRQRRGIHLEILIAVLYGWLLEMLDMRIFGTYHYGPVTWWWLGEVPVYIPLLWATIIHSSMALSDRSGLPRWARPFLDGLLAVLIDLAIDAIAIRVGLWHWSISLHEGWFGVPAGNLCAWMWVAAWYAGVTRLVRQRIEQRGEPAPPPVPDLGRGDHRWYQLQWVGGALSMMPRAYRWGSAWHRLLIPPVAYTGLFASLLLIGFSARLLHLEHQNERLWLFVAHLVAFLAVVRIASRSSVGGFESPVPASLVGNRWLMHVSFAVVLVWSGIWRETPTLIGVSGASMILEWWAQRWCQTDPPGQAPSNLPTT